MWCHDEAVSGIIIASPRTTAIWQSERSEAAPFSWFGVPYTSRMSHHWPIEPPRPSRPCGAFFLIPVFALVLARGNSMATRIRRGAPFPGPTLSGNPRGPLSVVRQRAADEPGLRSAWRRPSMDPNLVNPWGISENASSPVWISDTSLGCLACTACPAPVARQLASTSWS